MAMRFWIRQLFAPQTARSVRKAPARFRLDLERLEQRLAPAVTPRLLNGGILDIGFSAANDTATVSVAGSSIRVLDGTTSTDFAAATVTGINAHGNNNANQTVTFNDTITF